MREPDRETDINRGRAREGVNMLNIADIEPSAQVCRFYSACEHWNLNTYTHSKRRKWILKKQKKKWSQNEFNEWQKQNSFDIDAIDFCLCLCFSFALRYIALECHLIDSVETAFHPRIAHEIPIERCQLFNQNCFVPRFNFTETRAYVLRSQMKPAARQYAVHWLSFIKKCHTHTETHVQRTHTIGN